MQESEYKRTENSPRTAPDPAAPRRVRRKKPFLRLRTARRITQLFFLALFLIARRSSTTWSARPWPRPARWRRTVRSFEGDKSAKAKRVGELVAERAKAAGVEGVVFDRAGNKYHGRVAALADGACEGGLAF